MAVELKENRPDAAMRARQEDKKEDAAMKTIEINGKPIPENEISLILDTFYKLSRKEGMSREEKIRYLGILRFLTNNLIKTVSAADDHEAQELFRAYLNDLQAKGYSLPESIQDFVQNKMSLEYVRTIIMRSLRISDQYQKGHNAFIVIYPLAQSNFWLEHWWVHNYYGLLDFADHLTVEDMEYFYHEINALVPQDGKFYTGSWSEVDIRAKAGAIAGRYISSKMKDKVISMAQRISNAKLLFNISRDVLRGSEKSKLIGDMMKNIISNYLRHKESKRIFSSRERWLFTQDPFKSILMSCFVPIQVREDDALINTFAIHFKNEAMRADKAIVAKRAKDLGGIDMNSANLNLHIKRDGQGIPILSQQDLAQISSNLEGLDPVILSIKPASQTTVFAELVAH